MPRATLSFKLPEEEVEFQAALDVGKYQAVLNEIGNFLRSKTKHGDDSPEKMAVYQELYDLLNRECSGENIDWI